MKKRTTMTFGLLLGAAGIMLTMGSSSAYASTVDTIAWSTPYFTPDDASKLNSPYYRWYNQDWGWTHHAIAPPISSVTLSISAYDVDLSSGEVDKIYAYDNGVKTLLGTLAGASDRWSYTTFTLGANFFDDVQAGLQVWMDIDSTHTYDTWAVSLAKSVLSVDGGTLPDPEPTVPDGGASILLLGLGAFALRTVKSRA